MTLPIAISTTLTLTEVAEGLAHSAIGDNERERGNHARWQSRSPICAQSIPSSSSYRSIRPTCMEMLAPDPDPSSKDEMN